MKKILTILVIAMLICTGFFAYMYFNEKNNEVKVSAIDFEGKLSEIGELNTAEYVYTLTQVVDKEAIKIVNIKIPFTSSKIVYSYSGTIKAGIDFTKTIIEVDELNKKVTVKMPEAQIFSNELDNDSFKIYDEKNSVFNKISINDFNQSQADLKQAAADAAEEKGILEMAKDNAKKILENTIKNLVNDETYQIIVR